MRVIALSTLRAFWEGECGHPDAREPLLAWYRHTVRADWANPTELKVEVRTASILKNRRVVFNIGGNKYRIVTVINYKYRILYIRFVGTHADYDEIDAETI